MKKYLAVTLLFVFLGCPKKIITDCIKIQKGTKGVKFLIESRDKVKIGIVRIEWSKISYEFILKNNEEKNKHYFEIYKTRFGTKIIFETTAIYKYEIDSSRGRYLGYFIILDLAKPLEQYTIDFSKKNHNLKIFISQNMTYLE